MNNQIESMTIHMLIKIAKNGQGTILKSVSDFVNKQTDTKYNEIKKILVDRELEE